MIYRPTVPNTSEATPAGGDNSRSSLKTLQKTSKDLLQIVGLFSAISLATSTNTLALDIMAGINFPNKSVEVYDKDADDDYIASFSSKFKVAPTIGLRNKPDYISESNFGYFFQFDGAIFELDKQEIDGEDDPQDVGTSLSGFSVLATPTLFYHFNKSPTNWSQKVGLGVGAGYLSLTGDFNITDDTHPKFAQTIDVSERGWGLTVGLFFEISNDKHSFIISNFAPSIADDNYEYMQHNIDMMYRYKFSIDSFPFSLN